MAKNHLMLFSETDGTDMDGNFMKNIFYETVGLHENLKYSMPARNRTA